MFHFIIRRLLLLIPVILGVVTLVSVLIYFIPGNPVDSILGPYATAEQRQQVREALGIGRPVWEQIFDYFNQILRGDLGQSLIYRRPVSEMILERAQPTAELALGALLVALAISLPLGLLSAIRAGKFSDHFSMGFALLGISIPNFWLGPLLILLFSVHLEWLPVSGRSGLLSYILPSLTLGTALAAVLTRMTRTSVLENLNEDYVRTARSKGLRESWVLGKHVMRNASIPVVTIVGLQFGVLLTGSIITEQIFDWPGLGTLLLEGIGNRDYPVVQGCVFVFAITYVSVNLITDILYGILDPRIQLK